jgi:transcriptional regulator with XRE-family HTH domain
MFELLYSSCGQNKYKTWQNVKSSGHYSMISGPQIRAARAMLNWSAAVLAERTGVARQTIAKIEQSEGIPPARAQTLAHIQNVFEAAGIDFAGTTENPGVFLRRE